MLLGSFVGMSECLILFLSEARDLEKNSSMKLGLINGAFSDSLINKKWLHLLQMSDFFKKQLCSEMHSVSALWFS